MESDLAALAPHPSDKVSRKSIDTSIPLLLDPWAERVAFCLEPAGDKNTVSAIRRSLREMSQSGRLKEHPRLEGEIVSRLNEAVRGNQEASVVSLTITDGEVVDVEAGDTSKQVYGAVIDIGTTNICGYLVHLINGSLLTEAVRPNSQRAWGWDLMSRVQAASSRSQGGNGALGSLTAAVREDVDRILGDLLRQARMRRRDLVGLVFVGNSVMHHLFFGLPVESFGEAPYVPLKDEGAEFSPADLGLRLPPSARAHFLPLFSGFVGADALGVALALDLGRKVLKKSLLALDLGTNVELLLACPDGNLWCTSTPAGPTFEGGEIRCGMSSVPGAISEIDINGENLEIRTIEGSPPAGICGTGLIEAAGCLLDLGVLDRFRAHLAGGGIPPGCAGKRPPPGLLRREGRPSFCSGRVGAIGFGLSCFSRPVGCEAASKCQGGGQGRSGTSAAARRASNGRRSAKPFISQGAFGTNLQAREALFVLACFLLRSRWIEIHIVQNAAGSGGRLALLSRAKACSRPTNSSEKHNSLNWPVARSSRTLLSRPFPFLSCPPIK